MDSIRYTEYKALLEGEESDFFKSLMFHKIKVSTGKGWKTDWKHFCNTSLNTTDAEVKKDLNKTGKLSDQDYKFFGVNWLLANNITQVIYYYCYYYQ
jgi:hypothetical protein